MYFVRVKYYTKDYRVAVSHAIVSRTAPIFARLPRRVITHYAHYNIIIIYYIIKYALTEQRNVFTYYYNYLFRNTPPCTAKTAEPLAPSAPSNDHCRPRTVVPDFGKIEEHNFTHSRFPGVVIIVSRNRATRQYYYI